MLTHNSLFTCSAWQHGGRPARPGSYCNVDMLDDLEMWKCIWLSLLILHRSKRCTHFKIWHWHWQSIWL